MHYFLRRPFDLPLQHHTPPEVYSQRRAHRRAFLKALGIGATAPFVFGLAGCSQPSDEIILNAGAVAPLECDSAELYPAKRNPKFEYNRPETARRAAAEYTNFYEFSSDKDVWKHMPEFHPPETWQIRIDGDCLKPMTLDMDDIYRIFRPKFEERAYRHRCVEAWAMCVPWTGFPLAELIKYVEPKPIAKYVAFQTFGRREDAPNTADDSYPWPYHESLTIDEATNELAFLATGIYGEQLPKQHGTPIRLVVPWKYGFKSIKSLVKITLTDRRPGSFWNVIWPEAYDLTANVNPEIRHPSWSQRYERMLGTGVRYPTRLYNGYEEYVAKLYST